ncbi:hypothetical protein ELH24_10070 [Rhizobium ruizarguesonis]|uniref:hypothetical protein n=1 Tax=Rhizobium ruizarguesonis TaxID=2081791 RepID=UPI001030E8D3|nr:hypothetical protein [Rhizobium ruizarguesonis]TBC98984.1 hypothetical protein ELH25_10025 [Rhizobium ruizarguesonis]TBD15834.1 hypothetical protein ELH24_10070 [Rhizobium ruizarguesonis]TBD27750.1 hypothetical protein ELH20_09355 [Rhizobium ruizarguesonis]TBE32926.1 hypothetical protein ELH07_09875 [Rhizobium ruizarguesonis]TBE96848.1 hypothetical protein ELG98_09825 [Rhizobium ruizarguesonis]
MDLFSKDPKNADYDAYPLDREIAQPYAQRFWDAGNQIVLLAYASAFGLYVALASNQANVRALASQHWLALIAVAVVGNSLLFFLLWRMACHEYRLTRTYTTNPLLIDAVWSALHMRVGLLVFNLGLYLYVLTMILK